jgi:hypothetical protein
MLLLDDVRKPGKNFTTDSAWKVPLRSMVSFRNAVPTGVLEIITLSKDRNASRSTINIYEWVVLRPPANTSTVPFPGQST